MARYTADVFTPTRTFTEARNALAEMSDEELVRRIRHGFIPDHLYPASAWLIGEPEYEFLVEKLRQIADNDIRTVYMDGHDEWCDDFIVTSYLNGPHASIMVLYDQVDYECDDDGNPVYAHEIANPVNRMRSLGIATAPRERVLRRNSVDDFLDPPTHDPGADIPLPRVDAVTRLYDSLTTSPSVSTTTNYNWNAVYTNTDRF